MKSTARRQGSWPPATTWPAGCGTCCTARSPTRRCCGPAPTWPGSTPSSGASRSWWRSWRAEPGQTQGAAMKILFVTDRRVNAGSIQAVAGYVRAGDELGHTVAVYGPPDPRYPGVRAAADPHAFDFVVFLFESKLRWLSGLQLASLLAAVPRRRRAILDADGMYNRVTCVDGYDHNHRAESGRAEWLEYYGHLADKVMQPTFAAAEPGVLALPFYGYDPAAQVGPLTLPSPPSDGGEGRVRGPARKRYDLIHLGHNWWRWREVGGVLLPAIERVRGRLDGVCF